MIRSKFYVVEPSSHRDNARASVENYDSAWSRKDCTTYHSLAVKRAERLTVTPPAGSEADFIWSWYSDVLMNDRAREALSSSDVSGYSAVSVEVRNPRRGAGAGATANLWELQIHGFAGFADASGCVEVLQGCAECGAFTFRFHSPFYKLLNEEKWDGTDLFTIWPFPRIVLCSGRILKVIENYALTGISVIPIEEFELTASESRGVSAGMPSAYLDESGLKRLMRDGDYLEALMG